MWKSVHTNSEVRNSHFVAFLLRSMNPFEICSYLNFEKSLNVFGDNFKLWVESRPKAGLTDLHKMFRFSSTFLKIPSSTSIAALIFYVRNFSEILYWKCQKPEEIEKENLLLFNTNVTVRKHLYMYSTRISTIHPVLYYLGTHRYLCERGVSKNAMNILFAYVCACIEIILTFLNV